MTEEQLEKKRRYDREYMARRRKKARDRGECLPSETWWKRNRERHRQNGRQWRAENGEKASAIYRKTQARRRSTPWGKINNRIWPILHTSLKNGYSGSRSKYCGAIGYNWDDLRKHLEGQFAADMNWGNWGSVWELDHIKPLSSFQYESLEDPLFRECWALGNLRPLYRADNSSKGAKP